MKYIILILLGFFINTACKNVTGEQQDKLLSEVMGLHDEIMKSHDKLYNLQSQLKNIVAKSDTIPNGFSKEEVLEAANHAEQAYNEMNDWMRDFKVPENLNPNDQSKYLEEQKSKLEKLKESTQRALNEANAIINIKK
jgi:hypothetical protein